MIIIRGKQIESKDDAEYIVTKTSTGFTVTDKSGVAFDFDKTQLEFYPDIAYLARNIWGKPVIFWQSEIGHNRDGYSSICLRKKIRMSDLQGAYATFAVDEDGQPHAILYGDVFIDGDVGEVVIAPVDGTETGCDLFERHVPGITSFMKHSRAKVQALARFNAVDAISGLENQIDLLTTAVAALVEELPAEKRPIWWDQFIAVVSANSSNNLRGELKGISNVEVEKTKAREMQNAFFAKLTNG